MEPAITCRPLTLDDTAYFSDALELLNRTQGRDLFAQDYLHEMARTPDAHIVAAFSGHTLVGVGIAKVIDSFAYYAPFDPQLPSELHGRRVGSFSTLAVREDLQGRGLGQRLSRQRLDWLVSRGCDDVLGVSWLSGGAHTSDRVFEKMGFVRGREVPLFFAESSLRNPFDCPGCRVAPCACAAVLYRWRQRQDANFRGG